MSFEPRTDLPGLDPEAKRALVEVQTAISRECKRLDDRGSRPKRRVTELVEEGAVIARAGDVVRVMPGDEDITVYLPEPSSANGGEDVVVSFEGDGTAAGRVLVAPINGTCGLPGVTTLNSPGQYRYTSIGPTSPKPGFGSPDPGGSSGATWSGPPPVVLDDLPPIDNATLDEMPSNSVKVNATGATATPTDLAMPASTLFGRGATGNVGALTGSQVGAILRIGGQVDDTGAPGTYNNYVVAAGTKLLRINPSSDGDFIITGIILGSSNTDGWIRVFKQGSDGRVVFKHDSSGSTSTNRFQLPDSSDFVLDGANESCDLQYIGGRWQPVGRNGRFERLGAPVYDVVLDFDAAGDGIADDTAALNAAIAAANAAPGIIYLGKSHLVTAALTTLTGNNIVIRGRGSFDGGSDIIVSAAVAPTSVFKFTGQYCGIEDTRIRTASVYATGCVVLIEDSYRCFVRRCRLQGFANGIEVSASTLTNITDCELLDLRTSFGIWVHGSALLGQAHATWIEHCVCDTSVSTTLTWYVHDGYAHTVRLLDCSAVRGAYGLRVVDTLSGGADPPLFTRAVNLECDHNELGGVVLTKGEQAEFEQLFVTSVQNGRGIDIESTYGGDYRFDGGLVFSTTKEGMVIAADDGLVSGMLFGGCSLGSNNTYDAIAVAASTERFSIVGCASGRSTNDAVPESRYGLSIGSSCNNYVVVGNRFVGNVTGGILNTPGIASSRVVRNNVPDNGLRIVVLFDETGATGTYNNYAVGETVQLLRINPTGSGDFIITGLLLGTDNTGGWLRVFKQAGSGTDRVVFKHDDSGSTATNRFQCPGETDFILDRANDAVDLQYLGGRWQPMARVSGVTDGDKGDVTVSASGATWTIDANVVSNAKIRQSAALSVVGRSGSTTGNVADITADPIADVDCPLRVNAAGTALTYASLNTPGITDAAVTLAKMANLAQSRIIGRAEGAGTGVPTALTPTQVVSIIDSEAAAWTGAHSFADLFRLAGPQNLSTGSQQDNLNVATANRLRCSASAAFDLTGMVAGGDGQVLFISNIGAANSVRIVDERDATLGTASSAANRFNLQTNTSLSLLPRELALFVYDGTSARWRGGKLNSIA